MTGHTTDKNVSSAYACSNENPFLSFTSGSVLCVYLAIASVIIVYKRPNIDHVSFWLPKALLLKEVNFQLLSRSAV